MLPGRAEGLHLSETGRAQAERIAGRIAALEEHPVAVYSSPLERTRETARPIARALGLRVRNERGLIEVDIGSWTGTSLRRAIRSRHWSTVQRYPAGFRFPGGESFAEVAARTSDTILRLVGAHRGQTIVAVSHADTIRAVVATAAGIPLDLFQRIAIAPCSLSAICYREEGPRVLCVNAATDDLVPS